MRLLQKTSKKYIDRSKYEGKLLKGVWSKYKGGTDLSVWLHLQRLNVHGAHFCEIRDVGATPTPTTTPSNRTPTPTSTSGPPIYTSTPTPTSKPNPTLTVGYVRGRGGGGGGCGPYSTAKVNPPTCGWW